MTSKSSLPLPKAPNTAVHNDLATRPAHTPGPWEYRRDGDRHYVAYGICQIVEAAWGTIEADDFGSSKANSQEREANARLIAAAPDMLAALKAEQFVLELTEAKDSPTDFIRLLESVGDFESGWQTSQAAIETHAIRAALLRDAAIAKAERGL